MIFHHFSKPVDNYTLPKHFTFPFRYTPHPLCIAAAEDVKTYLASQKEWKEELLEGKMFGVLTVRNQQGELGFLAAFSGNLDGKSNIPYFVPPIYDLLDTSGFFKKEEQAIIQINRQIEDLNNDKEYIDLQETFAAVSEQATQEIASSKQKAKELKDVRDKRRSAGMQPTELENAAMIRESQFQKAEIRRITQRWNKRLQDIRQSIDAKRLIIENLKTKRRNDSASLQKEIFKHYILLNARGERCNLIDLFAKARGCEPPAGAGECAAPKLLQYAFLNGLTPICMAEFWWGNTPKNEIRRHGFFYPACKSKCEPILNYMLQGLDVDANPLKQQTAESPKLDIIYEDEWLAAVNKPADMLSVPGKNNNQSVFRCMANHFSNATGPIIVHRLDMATSGIMLIAKTKEVHQLLQRQFETRKIQKHYLALLEGDVNRDEGVICLPLCPNPEERPLQMVSYEYGKKAETRFHVLERKNGRTLVDFEPLTGRTHQLRIHAAHKDGLWCPIVGDNLYGQSADRLYLQAISIKFIHPITGNTVKLQVSNEFGCDTQKDSTIAPISREQNEPQK